MRRGPIVVPAAGGGTSGDLQAMVLQFGFQRHGDQCLILDQQDAPSGQGTGRCRGNHRPGAGGGAGIGKTDDFGGQREGGGDPLGSINDVAFPSQVEGQRLFDQRGPEP